MADYNLLDRMDYVGQRLAQIASKPITYSRADKTVSIPNATFGRTASGELDGYGNVSIIEQRQDFIFDASALESLFPPKHGDVIIYNGKRYEVLVLNGRTYQYTTPTHKRIRVFTKQLS